MYKKAEDGIRRQQKAMKGKLITAFNSPLMPLYEPFFSPLFKEVICIKVLM